MNTSAWKAHKLTAANVHSKWFKQLGTKEAAEALDFMNFAFWLRDKYADGIYSCKDPQRVAKMQTKFRDVCYAGIGRGVCDMHDALLHLGTHGGDNWHDENTEVYTPVSGEIKLYPGKNPRLLTAEACVNFVEEVEDCYKNFAKEADKHHQYTKQLLSAEQRKDWKEVGKALERIIMVAKGAEQYMWTAPKYSPYTRLAGGAPMPATTGFSKINSYTGLMSRLHNGATTMLNVRSGGGSDLQGGALAVFREIVDYALPILGGLYAKAIDWAIQFIPEWKRFVNENSQKPWDAPHGI